MSGRRGGWLTTLVAAVAMVTVTVVTTGALHGTGAWPSRDRPLRTATVDLYGRLERLIAAGARDDNSSTLRDPFGYGTSSQPTVRPRLAPKPAAPVVVERPMPVLTAVVSSDGDLQAVIRFNDRSYTVRAGSLFADFRVVSISADQAVLDDNGETIVLHRITKGD
jgi:hypothetical protein